MNPNIINVKKTISNFIFISSNSLIYSVEGFFNHLVLKGCFVTHVPKRVEINFSITDVESG